jgi:hypothetical protein
VDITLGTIEIQASWGYEEGLKLVQPRPLEHCLDQFLYLDKVDGAMGRIKPHSAPFPFVFAVEQVTIRRINIEFNAVIHNDTQVRPFVVSRPFELLSKGTCVSAAALLFCCCAHCYNPALSLSLPSSLKLTKEQKVACTLQTKCRSRTACHCRSV